MTDEQHIDDLARHIGLVREACMRLGKRLIARGRTEFGRDLAARGFVHDASKFHGIEWDYLHTDDPVSEDGKQLAIDHHRRTNSHHPEYWGGVVHMPEIAVAEMVCDWYARAQEFGTDLRAWLEEEAMPHYGIEPNGPIHKWTLAFIDLLLDKPFKPVGGE